MNTNCCICNSQKFTELMKVSDPQIKSDKKYAVVECNHCGLVFVNPQPKNIFALYPKNYSAYFLSPQKKESKLSFLHSIWGVFVRIVFGKNVWLQKPTKANALLDVGCASGAFLMEMKQLGWNGVGIEPSTSACVIAKRAGLNVINNPFEKAKFSKKFDLITMKYVIEHFANPINALKKANALLAPKGTLILNTPNIGSLEYEIFKENWGAFEVPRHLFLFNKKTIALAMKKAGFEEIKIIDEIYPASTIIGLDNRTGKKFSKLIQSKPFFWGLSLIYSIMARVIGTGRMIIIAKK